MFISCQFCGWHGDLSKLIGKYYRSANDPSDVIMEAVCPQCGNDILERVIGHKTKDTK